MATATFSKPISSELALIDITSQLTFASNITYVSGGVYIYNNCVHVQMRITATAAIAANALIVSDGMPSTQEVVYMEAINRSSITDRKRCYTSNSSAGVGKIRMSNIGSANSLTSGSTYVIRGFYPIEEV